MISKIDTLFLEVLYIFRKGVYNNLDVSEMNKIAPRSFIHILKKIILSLIKDTSLVIANNTPKLKGKLWLFSLTINNHNSLDFLKQGLNGTEPMYLKNNSYRFQYSSSSTPLFFKYKIFYDIISLFLLPALIIISKHRRVYIRYFSLAFDILGYYYESKRVLKELSPIGIVFANDHLVAARCMILAAKKTKIKTIYLQHASVTKDFPPLIFDLSLLEGLDSSLKYEVKSGLVKLIGMPKLDKHLKYSNTSDNVSFIGIAINPLDNQLLVLKLINDIINKSSTFTIILRPHPAITIDFIIPDGVEISNSKVESAFEYLSRIQLNISGDSSIHLEAIALNVVSVYYKFTTSALTLDYYGFLKNGLLRKCESFNAILEVIASYKEIQSIQREKLGFYNEAFRSDFIGESSIQAIKQIERFISPNEA